jgi:hypothetical protein
MGAGDSLESMKSLVVAFFPLLAIAAACGGKTPDAQSPENADESSSSGSDTSSNTTNDESERKPAAQHATIHEEDKSGPAKCGGADVTDLLAVLSQASCEVPGANPEGPSDRDVKDLLEITVRPDSPRIAPGSKSTIRVTFRNKSKTDLPLDFVVDPLPRFDFEVYTVKGTRADKPKGDEPSLPPEAEGAAPDKKIARITLAPQGTAGLTLSWDAVKYKWASKDKAKGAVPGHGYPREPAGPLPKGKYVLRVTTPLVGVFEGVDHEVSQPRTQIEIGNF